MTSKPKNTHLMLKTVIIGGVVAVLVYLFHPGVGQFSLLINGEPVAEPWFRLAAVPAVLLTMLFIGILAFMAMLGVGMMMFMVAMIFALLGILLFAPYVWPVLILFFLIIFVMSAGNSKNTS